MKLWYCHDCDFQIKSLAGARRHAKEAGPAFRPGGRMVSHKLTQEPHDACTDCAGNKDDEESTK